MTITTRELREQFNIQSSLFDRKFEMVEGRLDGLKLQIDEIRDNHLAHMSEQLIKNTTETEWIKKIQMWEIGLMVGALVSIVTSLIINLF